MKNLSSAYHHAQAKCQLVQNTYITCKQTKFFFLSGHIITSYQSLFKLPPPVCKLVTTKFSWIWETRSSISVLTKVFQLTLSVKVLAEAEVVGGVKLAPEPA